MPMLNGCSDTGRPSSTAATHALQGMSQRHIQEALNVMQVQEASGGRKAAVSAAPQAPQGAMSMQPPRGAQPQNSCHKHSAWWLL